MQRTFLFLDQAAALAGVSEETLRRRIRDGTLRATKKARRWRVRPEELERWLETSDEGRGGRRPARAAAASAPTERGSTAYPWERRAAGAR